MAALYSPNLAQQHKTKQIKNERFKYTLAPVHSQESGKDIGYGTLERRELRSVHPCRKGKGSLLRERKGILIRMFRKKGSPRPVPWRSTLSGLGP